METWEQVLAGIIGVLVILFFFPGIKNMMEKSKEAPTDWAGLAIPLIGVIVFVFILIASV